MHTIGFPNGWWTSHFLSPSLHTLFGIFSTWLTTPVAICREFVTGFRKRKQQRRKQAEKENIEKERRKRIQIRKEVSSLQKVE